MSSRSSRTLKKGRLFLGTHGDCFLHVTGSWLNYWPISLSSERLMLVRVTLSTRHHFLTTLSPVRLPYSSVWRGVSRDKYIEIDTNFAKQLGISTPNLDTEVVVEPVDDIERCSDLCLEPVSPEDLEKLESNLGKIEFELLNRIRVVSGQSFTFPIWIDSLVVPVRVVSSEPAATWVLLASEETGLRGERATVIRFKSAYSPSTSSSVGSIASPTGSEQANNSGSDQIPSPHSKSVWNNLPRRSDLICVGGLGSGSEASTPESEIDASSINSSAGSRLFDYLMRPFFPPPASSHTSLPLGSTSHRTGSRTPEPTISSAPSTVSKPASRSSGQQKHKKTKSWSHSSDPNARLTLPKYVETPDMNTVLRVQPHSIGGPDKFSMKGGRGTTSGPQWDYSRIFDVYVHPSTLPEISNYYHFSKHLGSFLVQVKSLNTSSKTPALQSSVANHNQNESRSTLPTSDTAVSSSVDSDNISSPVSDARMELSHIISTLAGLTSDVQSDASDASSSSARSAKPPPNLSLSDSLVLRLCFATKLVSCGDNNRVYPVTHPPLEDSKETLPESEIREELKIAPGHIVMSHIVQQQLQIGACSPVQVCHVTEEERLPKSHTHVAIHIHPLDEKAALMLEHRQKLESNMKSWVSQVHKINPFGAVLVSNQVLPLLDHKDNSCYFSLEIVPDPGSKPGGQQHQPQQYVMVTPPDLTPSRVSARVRITAEKPHPRSPQNELSIPRLADLNPPHVDLQASHFGGFDELLRQGGLYLRSAILQCQSGKPKGRLLISGTTGDAGLSCGKTSLALLLARELTAYPTCANLQIVECTTLRGQTAVRVGKRLQEIFQAALRCHPAVIVLDNLHNAMPHFTDVEEQTSGEGLLSLKKVQVLLDQLSAVDQAAGKVVVIATTRCRQDLHQLLLQSRGSHVFEQVMEILPPDLASRESILQAVMNSRRVHLQAVHLNAELRKLAVRTEGFQAGDLTKVVDRAISSAQVSRACPEVLPDTLTTPIRKQNSRVSFSFDEDGHTNPLTTRSLPSSPLKKHKLLKIVKSLSPPLNQRKLSLQPMASDSTLTLVDKSFHMTQEHDLEEVAGRRLTVSDFHAALDGFVPLTLRGLALHSAGSLDFSHVGGMHGTKEILQETILWPSKYSKLFAQCPIRMCRGLLLYGVPGTGKTLLAGSIAKEFGLNFVSVKGPEILSKYIGASEQAVRDLFVRAQAAKPCVLFFDEFDSLSPKRGHDRTGVTDRVVNQLLTQIDGVESLEGVYIIAASSRPDLIDPALLRPGRIDKSILCDLPNQEERLDILRALSREMQLQNTNLKQVAQHTHDYTGADLKAVLYSAQLRAAHEVLRKEEKKLSVSSESLPSSSADRTVESRTSADAVKSRLSVDTVESTISEGSVAGDEEAKVMVFRFNSGNAQVQGNADHNLEERATTLQRISREKMGMATLQQCMHGGVRKTRLCITQDDLTAALKDVKPSVSVKERQKFTEIYDKFTGKISQTLKAVLDQRATMA